MIMAAVQLPERLRFLPVFLALWVLSYLAPHLLAVIAGLFLQVASVTGSPMVADIGAWVVWVGLLPAAYAWAQWLLMRRCLSTAIPWAVAVLVGAFLGRLGQALIDDPDPRRLFGSEALMPVFVALMSLFGAKWAMTEFASTILAEGLYRSFQLSLYDPLSGGSLFWIRLLAISFVPRIAAWLLTAVVSGVLMHVVLRRGAARAGDQLYARFD
jgi:hypothetical protein